MTDFEKWSKYDVDEAEKKIEEETEIEQIKVKQAEKKAESRSLESEGIDIAEDLAAKAAAHARVAALRAKGSSRRNRTNKSSMASSEAVSNESSASPASGEERDELEGQATAKTPAIELNAQAQFLKELSIEMKALIEQRDNAVLQFEGGDDVEAFKLFQSTLEQVAAIECKLPEFIKDKDDNTVTSTESPITSDSETMAKKAVEAMRRTVHMVRVDTLRGLGQCQLSQGLFAEASESFKAALLAEGEDIASWIGRGNAFLSIGLSTLAELHFVQADSIIDKPLLKNKINNNSGSSVNSVTDINRDFRDKVKSLRALPLPPLVDSSLPSTVKECLVLCDKYCKEGSVCFKERFFKSACLKFTGALTCLNHAHKLSTPTTVTSPVDASAETESFPLKGVDAPFSFLGEAPALLDIRCSCHLSIAACFLQRARDYQVVVDHCTQVLNILSTLRGASHAEKNNEKGNETSLGHPQFHLKALLRRAEAYAKIGKFDQGVEDLQKALQLATAASSLGNQAAMPQSALVDIENRLERILYKKTQFADVSSLEDKI